MIRKLLTDWRRVWPVQALTALIIALLATYLPLLYPALAAPLRLLFLWFLPSAAGAWTSCLLSRSGLISYAAWIVPPVVHTIVPWIALGFLPSPFSMLLCAFISLTGAATGEVMRARDQKRK